MASKKSKSSTPAAASPAIRDLLKGAETPSQQLARLVTQSSGAASTVKRYTETDHTLDSLDLLVELSAASLAEFDAVLRKIRLVPGITGSETSLLLSTPRSTKAKL